MKKILCSFLLLLAVLGKGQSFLTKGQVYDFNVGDVMQTQYLYSSSAMYYTEYKTLTVLTKTFSMNNDTITYTLKKDLYVPAYCQTCVN
jgi:hypothetical protein